MSKQVIHLVFQPIAFILWVITVPLSLFDLFSSRVEVSIDLLITKYEHTSDWEFFDYMGSIKDLFNSGNQVVSILLVLFVLVGPFLKYLYYFFGSRMQNRKLSLALRQLSRMAFVDVFLVTLLLLLAYKTEYLVIRPHLGLYLLAGSVVMSFVGELVLSWETREE